LITLRLCVLPECGFGQIPVQREGKMPSVLKGETVYGKDVKLASQQQGRIQLPAIRESHDSSVTRVNLCAPDPFPFFFLDEIGLERLDFDGKLFVLVDDNAVALAFSVMIVVLFRTRNLRVRFDKLTEFVLRDVAEHDPSQTGVFVHEHGQLNRSNAPSLEDVRHLTALRRGDDRLGWQWVT
jgi:hypothetical protein